MIGSPTENIVTGYLCASASLDISPGHPTPLAGYGARTSPWRSLHSPLEVNAVLLGDGREWVLLISADILYFGKDLATAIEAHALTMGISKDRLFLTASHTHFAPPTDRSKPKLGITDDRYLEYLSSRLRELVDTVAAAEPVAATISASRIAVDLNVNRRRHWPWPLVTRQGFKLGPNIVMAPEPSGLRDEHIDVLQVRGANENLICVLWKFACHPVCFPRIFDVSAEFPGRARERVRTHAGRKIPVVFWQGFAGDARPRLEGRRSFGARVRAMRVGPGFGETNLAQWDDWSGRVGESLVEALPLERARTISGPLSVSSERIPISALLTGADDRSGQLEIKALSFGASLRVLFFGAEVCAPYLSLLGMNERTIGVGYTGDVFGYLPSEAQVREGGYEAGGYFRQFGIQAEFCDGFEAKVLAAATRVGKMADSITEPEQAR